jgi:hypothetical protein
MVLQIIASALKPIVLFFAPFPKVSPLFLLVKCISAEVLQYATEHL